jgi:hypothetical protein
MRLLSHWAFILLFIAVLSSSQTSKPISPGILLSIARPEPTRGEPVKFVSKLLFSPEKVTDTTGNGMSAENKKSGDEIIMVGGSGIVSSSLQGMIRKRKAQ